MLDLLAAGNPGRNNVDVWGERLDGNDVEIVYSRAHQAVEEIRKGGGPHLIEFMTYRVYEHVGPAKDHGETYRDKGKLNQAVSNDPLEKAKACLQSEFQIPQKDFQRWGESIKSEIEEAVEFAEQSDYPDPLSLYDDLHQDRNG